jgi:hypothetical protein
MIIFLNRQRTIEIFFKECKFKMLKLSYKQQLITEADLKSFIKVVPTHLQEIISSDLLEGIGNNILLI